jgi:hypothetical protein
MSRHVTSCHVMFMSRHVTSCSCHVMSRHVHVTSCHVMSRHVTSRQVTSCHVTSRQVKFKSSQVKSSSAHFQKRTRKRAATVVTRIGALSWVPETAKRTSSYLWWGPIGVSRTRRLRSCLWWDVTGVDGRGGRSSTRRGASQVRGGVPWVPVGDSGFGVQSGVGSRGTHQLEIAGPQVRGGVPWYLPVGDRWASSQGWGPVVPVGDVASRV